MNVSKPTETVPSLESTSATNEWVLRVCLGQEPCVLVLFLYSSTSPTFGPHEREVICLNKHLVCSSTTDLVLERRHLLQRELSYKTQFRNLSEYPSANPGRDIALFYVFEVLLLYRQFHRLMGVV